MALNNDNFVKQWGRQLAFDLPRIRTHETSRRRVLGVLLSILIVAAIAVVCWGPIAYFEYRFGGWGMILWIVVMYALAFGVRRFWKRSGNTVTLNLSGAPSVGLRDSLVRQRTILAALVNRAAFEAGIVAGETPKESQAGAGRSFQIQRLRRDGLWEGLPLRLKDALSMPEGEWTREDIGRVLVQLEAVRVLSWVVEKECELPPLRIAARVGPEILAVAFAEPTGEATPFLRSLNEIAVETQPALVYIARIQNELVKRGVTDGEFNAEIDAEVAGYMVYAASVGEAEMIAEDLPVGGQLVSEVASEELFHLRGLAAVRYTTLGAVRSALGGDEVPLKEQILKAVSAVP